MKAVKIFKALADGEAVLSEGFYYFLDADGDLCMYTALTGGIHKLVLLDHLNIAASIIDDDPEEGLSAIMDKIRRKVEHSRASNTITARAV
jgi:hypothetical protein